MLAILSCQFHDKKEMNVLWKPTKASNHQPRRRCNNAPPSGCGKVSWANAERGPLGFALRCEYWWNAAKTLLLCPFFSWQKTNCPLKTDKILDLMKKKVTTFFRAVVASLTELIKRLDNFVSPGLLLIHITILSIIGWVAAIIQLDLIIGLALQEVSMLTIIWLATIIIEPVQLLICCDRSM